MSTEFISPAPFLPDVALHRAAAELERRGYRSHEFGDAVLIEKQATRARRPVEHSGMREPIDLPDRECARCAPGSDAA